MAENYIDRIQQLKETDPEYGAYAEALAAELIGIKLVGTMTEEERRQFPEQAAQMALNIGSTATDIIDQGVQGLTPEITIMKAPGTETLGDAGDSIGTILSWGADTGLTVTQPFVDTYSFLTSAAGDAIFDQIGPEQAAEIAYRDAMRLKAHNEAPTTQLSAAAGEALEASTDLFDYLVAGFYYIMGQFGFMEENSWDDLLAARQGATAERRQMAANNPRNGLAEITASQQDRYRDLMNMELTSLEQVPNAEGELVHPRLGSRIAAYITGIEPDSMALIGVPKGVPVDPSVHALINEQRSRLDPDTLDRIGNIYEDYGVPGTVASYAAVRMAGRYTTGKIVALAESGALARMGATAASLGEVRMANYVWQRAVPGAQSVAGRLSLAVSTYSPMVKHAAGAGARMAGVTLGAMLRGGGKLAGRFAGPLGVVLLFYDGISYADGELDNERAVRETFGSADVYTVGTDASEMIELAVRANPAIIQHLPEGQLRGYAGHYARIIEMEEAVEAVNSGTNPIDLNIRHTWFLAWKNSGRTDNESFLLAANQAIENLRHASRGALGGEIKRWAIDIYENEEVAGPLVKFEILDNIETTLGGALRAAARTQQTAPLQGEPEPLTSLATEKLIALATQSGALPHEQVVFSGGSNTVTGPTETMAPYVARTLTAQTVGAVERA